MPRLVAMMPVRNEAHRWLPEVLEQVSHIADRIVIFDDASTDATPEICLRYPKVQCHRGATPLFAINESELRRHLWDITAELNPEWILALDADELFEPAALAMIPRLLDQSDFDAVAFRVFDFWNSLDMVRNDGAWNPWRRFSPLIIRYDPHLSSDWSPQAIHCGRFPLAYRDRVTFYSSVRLRHLGWARAEDHPKKYAFYRERDLAVYGRIQPHTESVLADTATVEPWFDAGIPEWLIAHQSEDS